MPVEFHRERDSPVRVYLSYAPPDAALMNVLADRLRGRTGDVRFQVYSDLQVDPGDVREERLAEWLDDAQIVLLLVSPAYLAFNAAAREAEAALRRRETGQVAVIPVILTHTFWQNTPFGRLQPLPEGGRPVDEWPEGAFDSVIRSLIQLVESRTVSPEREAFPTSDELFSELRFRTLWLMFSSYLVFSSLLLLGWYAAHHGLGAGNGQTGLPAAAFLGESAVAGLAAMSLIQIARRLFRVRGIFHRDAVNRWLEKPAVKELHARVRAGSILDMFDLPSEMLTGQLSAIAEQALDEQGGKGRPSELIRRMAEGVSLPARAPRTSESSETPEEPAPDSRTPLAFAIQRNLDQFQIATAAGWRRYLLLTSILLSIVLFSLGVPLFGSGSFIHGTPDPHSFADRLGNFSALLTGTILVGLLGGFLASIARDFVAIIEKLRR